MHESIQTEPKNSWKGKLWAIFLLWPFGGVQLTNSALEMEEPMRYFALIGAGLCWVISLFVFWKLSKVLFEVFSKK